MLFVMKKILIAFVALSMTISLAACKKNEPVATDANGAPVATAASQGKGQGTGASQPSDVQLEHSVDGEYLVFKLSSKVKLEVDAWIGICNKGNFIHEEDADNEGLTYAYYDARESETEDYIFRVGFADLSDGEYTMVLCDTDNAGYVIASWALTIKDGKPTLDYSGLKINEKPADYKPVDPAATVGENDDRGFDYDEEETEYEDDGNDDEPGETDDDQDADDDAGDA